MSIEHKKQKPIREKSNDVKSNKLICIICNKTLHTSDSQHICNSREKREYLHIIPK